MTHIKEIAAALRSRPTPMFLIGLASLAKRDFERTYSEIEVASAIVSEQAEREAQRLP